MNDEIKKDKILKKLNEIQQNLKANKSQHNKFGNYDFRSCEDILEAVKPLLKGAVLLLSDKVKNIGDRYYVEATAEISFEGQSVGVQAFAREELTKKGMSESQITGSSSSYARKYALNGLFCIDDSKDADTRDNSKDVEIEETLDPQANNMSEDDINKALNGMGD